VSITGAKIVTVSWLQLKWLHEISQSALAAAILILCVVILLELRSIKLMKRTMDTNLGRVFEQLDLLRFDRQTTDAPAPAATSAPAPAHATAPAVAASPPVGGNPYAAAAALASTGMPPEEIARRCGLAAGEARLLTSLAAAREGRRGRAT
jgi:hypothetical protein